MQKDKATVQVAGTSMMERVASALDDAGCQVVLIGRNSIDGGRVVLPDDDTGGPAAGLATALRIAAGRPVFLAATDQPLLRHETISALLAIDGTAVVPLDDGVRQTTCAVYRAGCAATLRDIRRETPAPPLQRLLDAVTATEVSQPEWSAWGEDGRSWWSIDTPDDLARLREQFGDD